MALPNPNSSGEFALRELIRQNEDAAHMRQQAFDTAKETLTIQKNIDKAQVYEGMKAGEDRKKRIQKPIQELTGTGNNKNISALNNALDILDEFDYWFIVVYYGIIEWIEFANYWKNG